MEDGIDSCPFSEIPALSQDLPESPLRNDADSTEFKPLSIPHPDSSDEIPNPPESPLKNDETDSAEFKSIPFHNDFSAENPNSSDNSPTDHLQTHPDVLELESLQVSDQDASTMIANTSENLLGSPASANRGPVELEEVPMSYQDFGERSVDMEDKVAALQAQNLDLLRAIEEISAERNALRNDIVRIEDSTRKREEKLMEELEETRKEVEAYSKSWDSLHFVKECMVKIIDRIDQEKTDACVDEDEQMEQLSFEKEPERLPEEVSIINRLGVRLESLFVEHEQKRKKEIKELENSIVSLTEENRDISNLLRIALVEKEAVEKALNRLKGGGDQKRVAILQIAERGLQKVGFGFMMGASSTGDSTDGSDANAGARLDSSEGEEEVVSLASTVEKIMKNLRLEITQLKRALEESRSDNERLHNLSEKQAHEIAENTLYIKDLEERESTLTQNVEELMIDLTYAEEEVARWREACELEVEAGKAAMEERDKEAAILRDELEKTKVSLELANNKLKVKDELAAAAMSAQAAAVRSLRLADSRAAGCRERIEELTRQLEEIESKGERKSRRKVRHICWPWPALRINPAALRRRDINRRSLPEMESLLR
ncbi:hypothetical protein MRB53_004642 [Persea americana]|uniref:Uncharacterized protein n=1 Tax=Persea americana TaxID=3435 RepID=A0ACC2MB07_PERAE|nr:hypothetical protein MRB53_004642 [Persea americana]